MPPKVRQKTFGVLLSQKKHGYADRLYMLENGLSRNYIEKYFIYKQLLGYLWVRY